MEYITTSEKFQKTYKKILKKIMKKGADEDFTKAKARQLINVNLEIKIIKDKAPILGNRVQPLKMLKEELANYMKGYVYEYFYHSKNIFWWDYAFIDGELINTYPTFMKNVNYFNNKPTKNNVVTLWDNQFLSKGKHITSQTPCISQINLQIIENKINLIITQRSGDASLGVPADVYQMYLLGKHFAELWNRDFDKLIFNFNNIHVYHNNFKETEKYFKNWNKKKQKYNFIQN